MKTYYKQGDQVLTFFICLYLIMQALNYTVYSFGLKGTAWNIISKAILAASLVYSLLFIIKRKAGALIITESIFLALFGLSYYNSIIPADFNSIVFSELFVFIPMGIASYCIFDLGVLQKYLYYSSYGIELLSYISLINKPFETYSMTIGYMLLLPLLIHLDSVIYERRIWELLIVLVDLILIIIFASRGPLLCFAIYFVLKIVYSKQSTLRRVIFISITIFIALILYLFYQNFLELVIKLLDTLNISSRTIQLYLSGSIDYATNRDAIFNYYVSLIKDSPLLGFGLAGNWIDGIYPHNIILEILMAFGTPIGIVILLFMSGLSIYSVMFSKNDRLLHILIADLVSLNWSGSFLMNSLFFVGLFICLKNIKFYRLGEFETI